MSGKRDRSLSKAVPTRRPYVVSRAVRSSLEAATDSRGSHSHQWFDLPYALSCPVDRDINVERWVEDSVDEVRASLSVLVSELLLLCNRCAVV